MLVRIQIVEPAAEILSLAAGIILFVGFAFVFSFYPQRALWG
jgi:hypothetical protein